MDRPATVGEAVANLENTARCLALFRHGDSRERAHLDLLASRVFEALDEYRTPPASTSVSELARREEGS